MSYRELRLSLDEPKSGNSVYVIPRSKKPDDYAIISTIDEHELLRRGITGTITFYCYEPVRKDLESRIKQFLKKSFRQRLAEIQDKNRKLKLGLLIPPILAFLFIFTGFFDDLVVNITAIALFVGIHRREVQKRHNISTIEARIDALTVKENRLLTEIYRSFSELDAPEFQLPDLETLKQQMSEAEIRDTLNAIGSFLHLDKIRELQSQMRSLNRAISQTKGLRSYTLRFARVLKKWQLTKEQQRLKQNVGVKPGFRDIYEILLEESNQEYSSLILEPPSNFQLPSDAVD